MVTARKSGLIHKRGIIFLFSVGLETTSLMQEYFYFGIFV